MSNPTASPQLRDDATNYIISAMINDQGVEPASLVDPVELFVADYSSNHGNGVSLTPDRVAAARTMLGMAAAGKRDAEARSPRSPASSSPVKKRQSIIAPSLSSLPCRSMLSTAASFVESVAALPSAHEPRFVLPPALR